jgi:hypothetical protein
VLTKSAKRKYRRNTKRNKNFKSRDAREHIITAPTIVLLQVALAMQVGVVVCLGLCQIQLWFLQEGE